MNLIIFGASGATGQELIKQSLAAGHSVAAFIRNPAKLTIKHAKLRLVIGDLLNPSTVAKALPGHDAVLVSLGAPARRACTLRSQGTSNIVHAMEAAGIKRLVCQSSLGFGDSEPVLRRTSFIFRNIIVPLLLRDTFEDHARQEDIIKNSNLDWTIVRPGNLTNKPGKKTYRHGFTADDPTIKVKISRADVAYFMLHLASSKDYERQAVGISD